MQAKRSFFTMPGKKVWKCLLAQEIPCPNGLEASFLNSATSIWEVLPKWNLWWKHFASTGSFAPSSNDFRWFLHGICWAKAIGFHFFTFLGMCKRNNIFYQRNIKLMFAHVNNMCNRSNLFFYELDNLTSNLCSHTSTACAGVATYSTWTKHITYVRAPEHYVQA